MALTRNFTEKEFICKCKMCSKIPELYLINVQNLSKILQILRDDLKTPIIINSGIRCREHNKKSKGKINSRHLTGLAADICSKYFTPIQLRNRILELEKEKKIYVGYIQLYATFVHIDIRGIYTSNYYLGKVYNRDKKSSI